MCFENVIKISERTLLCNLCLWLQQAARWRISQNDQIHGIVNEQDVGYYLTASLYQRDDNDAIDATLRFAVERCT